MEVAVGLKKESPITYSNGKRLFTIDQKVDALVRIKMTGCSKAEVARSLHVAESTFRGWFKNKDIVMKAEVKYNEMKMTKCSSASSDGYKSDDNNSKSFSVDGSEHNSSTYTDDRENSRSRFSSPDNCGGGAASAAAAAAAAAAASAAAPVVRRSPERRLGHHKQKLKKQQQHNGKANHNNNNNICSNNNNNINSNNNNNNSNNNNHIGGGLVAGGLGAAIGFGAGLNGGLNGSLGGAGLNGSLGGPGLNGSLGGAGLNGSLGGPGLNGGLNGSLVGAGLNGPLGGAGLNGGLNAGVLNGSLAVAGGLSQQQLQHHLSQLAHHHPLHPNLSSLAGLKGTNAAAAFAAAAAVAAAANVNDPANLKLSPAELHSKLNSYFNPSPLLTTSLPGSINFLPPNFTTAENSYNNKSSSFINTMVTATLMEPQALDLSTHSRNKCKDSKPSLTANMVTTTTTTQTSPKILRRNSYRKLFKPYKSRCTDDVVHSRQGINPRNPLWPLQ